MAKLKAKKPKTDNSQNPSSQSDSSEEEDDNKEPNEINTEKSTEVKCDDNSSWFYIIISV